MSESNHDLEVLLYGGSGPDNGSYRYRVLNLKEQLDLAGIQSQIITDLGTIAQISKKSDTILVLHRTAWNYEVNMIKKFAKKNSIPLIYDIDDYVFDPSINRYVRGIEFLTNEQKKEYETGVNRYRRTLLDCDAAITSTKYLSDRITENGINSFVHRNAISTEMVSISEKIRGLKHKRDEILLGYFSGTHTHNYDFEECSEALLQILEKFKKVKLFLVGPLEIDPKFNKFSNRIIRSDLVHWKKLPELIASVDINLAPLEISNPFCQAKSELKFFEAALVNVPTIASSTESFQHAIKNHKNGFLASNKEEWLEFLHLLITDENLRRKIASDAMVDSYDKYTNHARAKETNKLFKEILDMYTSPKNSVLNSKENSPPDNDSLSLKISWVVDTPEPNQGGFRNITRNCQFLSKFGHSITLYVNPGSKFKTEEEVRMFIDKYYGPVNYLVKYGHVFDKCDVLIATFWTTAYNNVAPSNAAQKKIYFVQDFEPYFYQMGPEYIMSERSYQLGLYHITSFPWLTDLIRKRYGGTADYYLPPIDRGIYKRVPKVNNKKSQILFYGRPDQPRRCYDLGIQALNIVSNRIKDVDIIIFGSNKIDSSKIPFVHINKGSLPKISDLAELYQQSDVGIVFSTTNPSLLSFEMMTCGLPVVDLDLEANRLNYGSADNAALCEPTPISIANKIIELMENETKRKVLAENGYRHSLMFPNVEDTARQIEALIIKAFLDKNEKKIPMKETSALTPDLIITRNDSNVGEILKNTIVKQSFVPELDGLQEIHILFGTYGRKTKSHISIDLCNSTGKSIKNSSIAIGEIKDNEWYKFYFPKVTNSKGNLFYLVLSSNDAKSGDAVTVYKTKQNVDNSRLYINERLQMGSLCFQTFCDLSHDIVLNRETIDKENYTDLSSDDLLNKLSQKIMLRNNKLNSHEQKIYSLEETNLSLLEKFEKLEDKINILSDSLSQTKFQVNKLDSNIYRFSQITPIRIILNLLRRFSK